MTSKTYYDRIETLFEDLEERFEALDEDPDVATAAGVINVTFANGVVFVFSRQPPTEQLWLATPGGGFHYEWDNAADDWRDTKTGELFRAVVVSELAEHAGIQFSWAD